jgi:hypothetical protein
LRDNYGAKPRELENAERKEHSMTETTTPTTGEEIRALDEEIAGMEAELQKANALVV